jgi:L-aspartate oxidase
VPGVRGANRLASNSLLEGSVFPLNREAIVDGQDRCRATGVLRHPLPEPVAVPRGITTTPGPAIRHELQRVMTRDAGVLRSAKSLERAADALGELVPTDVESANLHAVSTVLVRAATARRESRGRTPGRTTRSRRPRSSDV